VGPAGTAVLVLMVSLLEPWGVTCARFADEVSVVHLDCGISDCFGSGIAVLWMRATALTSAAMALLSRDSMFGACVCLANCLVNGGNDFFFDRDYGAPSNFHFKTVFFMRFGGLYPPQYCSKKELQKRRKVVLEFLVELLVSIDNSGGNDRLRGPGAGNGDDNPQ
jgi:hypothetical protein